MQMDKSTNYHLRTQRPVLQLLSMLLPCLFLFKINSRGAPWSWSITLQTRRC